MNSSLNPLPSDLPLYEWRINARLADNAGCRLEIDVLSWCPSSWLWEHLDHKFHLNEIISDALYIMTLW